MLEVKQSDFGSSSTEKITDIFLLRKQKKRWLETSCAVCAPHKSLARSILIINEVPDFRLPVSFLPLVRKR